MVLELDARAKRFAEFSADRQTLMGKLPFGVLQAARRHHVPVALIAGRIANASYKMIF